MGSKMIQGFMIGTLVVLLLAAAVWLIPAPDRETEEPSQSESTDVAVLPSDGGTDQPVETAAPSPPAVEDTPKPTGDRADPEQVARDFMTTYPGDVQPLADPTFLASLDGVDAPLLEQVTDMSLEQVDHVTGDTYERYAYTVSGTYRDDEVPVYSIVVARPAEPGEGGSTAKNELPFQVHSFDWAPEMLGDENSPGPAADALSPISVNQRGNLISQTHTDVISQILTVDPDESTEQRQARLDELTVEPTDVTPPMSRSGRYAMTTEILSQTYSTEPGGPITIAYAGTWVDPYDPTYNGSWSLTVTITRDDDGRFIVRSVEQSAPTESKNDE
ncbi:hypothetical protein ACT3SQ_18450 [Brachybacterium sp. AOP42-C2-15]|uniref:hypothetical protein n=1 Tax=Brachybacterium sp. AOP42-C2-15 TaxID=3457670 RepID=UPI004034C4DA